MSNRMRSEIEFLRGKYPDLSHGAQFEWILIPQFPLPQNRFNQDHTQFLINIPPAYPATGPDNFFVERSIRLKNEGVPPGLNLNNNSSSGPARVPGNWAWFSWHPKVWHPKAKTSEGDNLYTFIRSAIACLKGAEMT